MMCFSQYEAINRGDFELAELFCASDVVAGRCHEHPHPGRLPGPADDANRTRTSLFFQASDAVIGANQDAVPKVPEEPRVHRVFKRPGS
jgi:hypothetical protein